MTPQEIVNRVYQVFIVDKAPRSMTPDGDTCIYGDPDEGPGCAAACLFDRETRLRLHRFEDMQPEGQTAFSTALDYVDLPEWAIANKHLIAALQAWHDGVHYGPIAGDKSIMGLIETCHEFNLQYPGDQE